MIIVIGKSLRILPCMFLSLKKKEFSFFFNVDLFKEIAV